MGIFKGADSVIILSANPIEDPEESYVSLKLSLTIL